MNSSENNFERNSDSGRIWEANQGLLLTSEKQYLFTNSSHSVRIIELMMITAIVGVMIALTKSYGLVGAMILFGCMFAMTVLLWRFSRNSSQIRFWNQTIWGIVMPIACLINDPFLFATFDHGKLVSIEEGSFFGTCAVLILGILFLLISWICRKDSPAYLNGLVAGTLFGSGSLMFYFGLMALPVAVFTLPALVGMVGLVPWITGIVYFRTAKMHLQMGSHQSRNVTAFAVVFAFLLTWTALISINVMGANHYLDSFTAQFLGKGLPK